MRTIAAALLLATLAAPARAQTAPDHVLTPAPVPGRIDPGLAPVERAGRPDGSDRSAPFSGLPTGIIAGSGQGTPSTVGSPTKENAPTPSLSR